MVEKLRDVYGCRKKFHGSFHQPRQIGASQREQTMRGALDWDQLSTVCESHFMEKYGKNT